MTSGWRRWCRGIAGMGTAADGDGHGGCDPGHGRNTAPAPLRCRRRLAVTHGGGAGRGSPGHIWAATDGGLARYDGNSLRVWEHDPEQPGSLPGNEIETLLIDPLDRVWVGINGKGVARLDADRALPDLRHGQFHLPGAVLGAGLCRQRLVDRDQQPWRLPAWRGRQRAPLHHDPAQPGPAQQQHLHQPGRCAGPPVAGHRSGRGALERQRIRAGGRAGTGHAERAPVEPGCGGFDLGRQPERWPVPHRWQDRVSRPRWADSAQLRSALVLPIARGYWAGTSDGLLRGMRRRCAGWRATAAGLPDRTAVCSICCRTTRADCGWRC